MSYDYSSSNTRLEMPNPYRVQNLLLLLCSAALVLAGLSALWMSRLSLSPAAILMGLALLAVGITMGATAAKRLRFFFGRGRPRSLAPELEPGVTGNSPPADHHKGLLRQGALVYPEPTGAVDGVLYHLAPRLITAPIAIQAQARTNFFNLAALIASTLSFAVAWLMFGSETTRPWLSVGYFLFGAAFLLKPVVSSSTAKVSTASLVVLIAAAVLGPALLGAVATSLPDLQGWSLAPQTATMLASGLIGVAIAMLATLGQIQQPPATQTSSEQQSLSLNVPPSLLIDELERQLQSQWVEKIPNRRYARATPMIDPALHSGPFQGEIFEETQPMPMAGSAPQGLAQALASARHKWIAVLDLYASALVALAVGCAVAFSFKASQVTDVADISFSLLGATSILIVVASFCFKAAATLWGRFDFESVLLWVEINGTYQTSSIGTGNALSSRVQTNNQVVRTESMTLRVWRARIESVVFGKDGQRQVTAMFSTDAEARELAHHLIQFGQSRASMVSPDSSADLARMRTLALSEQALTTAAAPSSLEAALIAGIAPAAQLANPAAAFCHACGSKLQPGALFCSACGAKQEQATSA